MQFKVFRNKLNIHLTLFGGGIYFSNKVYTSLVQIMSKGILEWCKIILILFSVVPCVSVNHSSQTLTDVQTWIDFSGQDAALAAIWQSLWKSQSSILFYLIDFKINPTIAILQIYKRKKIEEHTYFCPPLFGALNCWINHYFLFGSWYLTLKVLF